MHVLVCLFLVLLGLLNGARAYIPALSTNDTSSQSGGPNVTDVSMLYLNWYMGSYSETVSYQLVGSDSDGMSQGALVHFSEPMSWNNQTSTTPWIALVACDANSTTMSLEDDIFTLARDRGAKAALLYSLYSQACVINAEYADPANFEQVMDIFSTQSLTSAKLIEYQFGSINQTVYGDYNATTLNATSTVIASAIADGSVDTPSYLFATLRAYNSTASPNTSNGSSGSSTQPTTTDDSGGGGSPNTGLAMIILYAITGCVSALFCVVIVTGAVRAIRHPERYGPRNADSNFTAGGPFSQSRTQGLTRAILDTFPVIKFGRTNTTDVDAQQQQHYAERDAKDLEAVGGDMSDGEEEERLEMEERGGAPAASAAVGKRREAGDEESGSSMRDSRSGMRRSEEEEDVADSPESRASGSIPPTPSSAPVLGHTRRPSARATTSSAPPESEVVPDAIGRETCPICILDFEEGDDLRVLPCEGQHRFHQQCVDPWLLELSSSCPICRHDFHALETMMTSDPDGPPNAPFQQDGRPTSVGSRFSRYIRSAIRRRRHREEADSADIPIVAPESGGP